MKAATCRKLALASGSMTMMGQTCGMLDCNTNCDATPDARASHRHKTGFSQIGCFLDSRAVINTGKLEHGIVDGLPQDAAASRASDATGKSTGARHRRARHTAAKAA